VPPAPRFRSWASTSSSAESAKLSRQRRSSLGGFAFLGLCFVLLPRQAFAHAGLQGIGDFWNGLLHLGLDIKQGILIAGLGLVLGRAEGPGRDAAFTSYYASLAGGLLLGLGLFAPETQVMGALPLAAVGLLLIDPGGKLSSIPAGSVGVTALLTGLAFGADRPASRVGFIFLAGMFIGAVILPVYVSALWARFKRPWFLIGARVIGSWLIAIALMLFGLSFRPETKMPPAAEPTESVEQAN
jgi:hydrogenase/urease accessory protein HupE